MINSDDATYKSYTFYDQVSPNINQHWYCCGLITSHILTFSNYYDPSGIDNKISIEIWFTSFS